MSGRPHLPFEEWRYFAARSVFRLAAAFHVKLAEISRADMTIEKDGELCSVLIEYQRQWVATVVFMGPQIVAIGWWPQGDLTPPLMA